MNRRVEVFIVPKNKEGAKKSEPYSVGGANINSLDSSWDAFPVFTEHPLSLKMLSEICTAHHLKNLLPLQS